MQNRFMVFAFVFAVLVHVVLFFLLDGLFKPKAYVADQTSYRLSLNARADDSQITPDPESVVHIPASQPSPAKAEPQTLPKKTIEKTSPEPLKKIAKADQTEALKPDEERQVPQQLAQPTKKATAKSVQQITSTEFKQRRISQPEREVKKPEQEEPEAKKRQVINEQASADIDAKPSDSADSEPAKQEAVAEQAQANETPAEEPLPKVREPQFQIGSANNPKPTYPQRAINRGWEGDVVLGVHIDADGTVTYVEILESSNVSALDFAAYSTVMDSWRFSPADEDERELRGYVTVPISFRIN
jgi:TonB family protein